jgi:YesN/AraC family two-component response regulator
MAMPEKYRVLIAEDDEEVRELIVNTLNPHYVVYSAANGSAALSLSEKVIPDLILSDLAMPMMDGLTFCRAVRERFTEKYIPFIILTGRNSEEQKLICFQNGVDDFMEKPFSPELLRWRVKSMLQAFSKIGKDQGSNAAEISIPESADDRFIQDVISIIDKNLDKEYLNVEFMASEMCMSRATFYRKMDTLLSESPSTYIRKYRLKRAAILLSSKKYSVSEVSYHVGFNDPNYFAKCFQKEFNTSPSAYSS